MIAAGTRVQIKTSNGGEILTVLTSSYSPTYTAYIADGAGFIDGLRIVSVEAV
jgi:hypothetical protein